MEIIDSTCIGSRLLTIERLFRKKVNRREGGIEPLHVSMPHDLKSCPSTSPSHHGS
jgi:hypothetical protein